MDQMSFFSLLILCLIFGFFVESEAMNSRQSDLAQQRRRRASPPFSKQTILFDKLATDVNETTNRIQAWLNKTEESVKRIMDSIAQGLAKITAAGTKNATVIVQWKSMQSELRSGIELIIDAYNKYLALHETLLVDIRKYVQGLIKKYTAERAAVDQMVPPSVSPDSDQLLSDSFQKILSNYLRYAHGSGNTLMYSFDAFRDAFLNAIDYHTSLLNPPNPPPIQRIPVNAFFPDVNQYGYEPELIYCDDIDQNNGDRICANSLGDASLQWASRGCSCQTYE